MKFKTLEKILSGGSALWAGRCQDCKKEIEVLAGYTESGEVEITGGAVYQHDPEKEVFILKCDDCYQKKPGFNYQQCEVYTRCVGYLRPEKQMHNSKRAEIRNRKNFDKCL